MGATIANLEVSWFLITLDEEFRCLVELACKISDFVCAGVLPASPCSHFVPMVSPSLCEFRPMESDDPG